MGLDMYLEGRLYVSQYAEPEGKLNRLMDAIKEEFPGYEDTSGNFRSLSINLPLMYWRKANAIHGWFVNNVQDGVDNCQTSEVSRGQLEDLQALVNEILDAKTNAISRGESLEDALALAEKKLPPHEGFFFGSTDINEWYFEDLEYTSEALAKILAMPVNFDYFTYYASW